MKNKIIFWGLLIALLSLVPLTILPNVSLPLLLKFPATTASLLQRFLGLILFILLFWQIMLGSFMEKWTDKLGGWVFTFHVWEGIIIYTLAVLHPITFLFFRHFSGLGTDPIFIFLGFCLFCQAQLDLYYTIGRIAFWLLTIGVFAGLFRASTPFMRANWRKFHVINYLVFLIVGIHGLSLGTDFKTPPFFYFAIIAYLLVLYTVIRKLPGVFTSYKNWINS